MENLYSFDRTANPLRFNVIAHFVGLKDQDNQTAGKIRQIAAQCHTDSYTG